MSDEAVLAAIQQMEMWLADSSWNPDPEALARWNVAFQEAMAGASKGPAWQELMTRSHVAGERLEARIGPLAEARDKVKAELDAQERGHRALRGYSASLGRST